MRTLLLALISLAVGVVLLAWWVGAPVAPSAAPAPATLDERVDGAPGASARVAEVAAPVTALDVERERDALAPSEAQRAREEREAQERTSVIGRVVDEFGAPQKGVRVLYALAERGPETPLDALAWQAPERMLGETYSRDDGRFAIAPAAVGVMRLALRSTERAPRDLEGVFVTSGRTTDLGDLELLPGLVLAGRVLSADGAPVAGAWLIRPDSSVRPGLGSFPGERGVILGQSAPDGSFRLPPQPVGPWTLLLHSSDHPDFVARSAPRAEGRDETHLELRFPPTSTIEGRVVIDAGPHAPPGFELEVLAQALDEQGGERSEVRASSRRATLGQYGEFVLAGIAPESLVRVQVQAPSASAGDEAWRYEASVEARGGERDVLLKLGAVASLEARARDARTGEWLAVSKALAQVRESSGTLRLLPTQTTIHPDGRVVLRTDRRVEPQARVLVTLRAAGYFSAISADFALAPGASVDLGALDLEPRPRLDFRVLDAASARPIRNARVVLAMGADALASVSAPPSGSGGTSQLRSELTDAQGETHVWGESNDCGWATARAEGFAASAPLEVCFGAASGTIEIALNVGPTLAVRVLDPAGAPAPSRKVVLRRNVSVDVSRIEAQRFLELEGLTDSEGLHRFEGLTPGAYRAALVEPRVGAPRSPDEHARTFATTLLAPDGETQLDLYALPRGVLSGRVSLARAPLSNAVVTLTAPNTPHPRAWSREGPSRTRTDAEGRYRFDQLGPGDWNVSVFHADLLVPTATSLAYDGDARTFDIVILRTALVGRVVDKAGNPLAGARVAVGRWQPSARARDRRAKPFQRIEAAPIPPTDADGRFTILGAPGERIALEVRHPQYQRLETKPFVPDLGVERDLGDLVLEAAASVRVELARLQRDNPRPRVVLRRLDGPKNESGEREVRTQSLDASGRAQLRALAPGKWRVEIDPRVQGRPRPRLDVKLVAHELRVVEFEGL